MPNTLPLAVSIPKGRSFYRITSKAFYTTNPADWVYGLRARSCRSTSGTGAMVVLFDDQSTNIQAMNPYLIEFRLLTPNLVPFQNIGADLVAYTTGEVRITGTPASPPEIQRYSNWRQVPFNH
jgi:hypothetical protein